MQRKMTKIPASHIPQGTVYGLASFEGNRPYSLNKAEVIKGTIKLIQARGDIAFLTFCETVDSSGRRVVVFPTVSEPRLHILTVTSGAKRPIQNDLLKRFYNYWLHSFSPDGRFLAYVWVSKNADRGIGIYDTISQQKWEQSGASFAAWSGSGQHLVFARFSVDDGPLPKSNNQIAFPERTSRSGSAPVDDMYFFAKSLKDVNAPKTERISQAQAIHLVGKWYRSVLLYVLAGNSNGSHIYSQIVRGAAVAPDNRGIVVVDSYNKNYNAQDPMPPETIDMEWTTRYVDVQGRSIVYNPSPPLTPLSWSRDGERIYGLTGRSNSHSATRGTMICLWVRSGRYAEVTIPEKVGTVVSYIED